jgi:arylsulfatase A-like enzyme
MSKRPNIVLIYADDLGFGDVRCFDPRSRIATPHIDALAEQGVRFTDAHAPDAICSPSRYGILTGRYSWQTERKKGNPPPGEQPWINADRLTLADYLDYDLEDGDAEDSMSFLDEFLEGPSGAPRRDMAIYHTADNKLALRQGNWVYVDDPSGDNGEQEPAWFRGMRGVRPHQHPGELFDLTNDPKQRYNRYSEVPEKVAQMKEALEGFVDSGRTAPRRGRG